MGEAKYCPHCGAIIPETPAEFFICENKDCPKKGAVQNWNELTTTKK